MTNLISEGMRHGDLADLVLPMISVDEYVSKVSEDAGVFGFFVSDKDAADDLNRFIQKSPYAILDTDISPAPDKDGYYIVFVEIAKNTRLPETFDSVLDEVGAVSGVEEWRVRTPSLTKLVDYSSNLLGKIFGDVEDASAQDLAAALTESSGVSKISVSGPFVSFHGLGADYRFEVDNTADMDCSFSLTGVSLARRLETVLGEGWSVEVGERSIVLENANEKRFYLRKRAP